MKYADLDFKVGSVNPSGIGVTIYRIPRRFILAFPTVLDDPDDENVQGEEDLAAMKGSFTLKEGAYFTKMYSTQGKGSMTYEPLGEIDCKMFTNHLNASFPDLTLAALGYSKTSVNDDYVYIGKSAGRWHVVGSPDYRSTTECNGSTGDAAGSAKGVTIAISCPDVTPLPIYTGTIVLEDGTFDCSTGEFTPKSGD